MKKFILIIFVLLVGCSQDYSAKGSVGFSQAAGVKKICIEGHVYYYTKGGYQGGIAPKLHNDGRPVKCEDE